ncbi:putative TetR family transcriptional regulator [Gordonia araii NBRC 100433]|uniref:Putative TetR family transcriptional regulator n=1 Tax=Gordonia araii NBRC 100433 TaxID=1073574 RepID=G7H5T5_9ACTN|nr:TetR/AcrR family transcriptional regulator [Gordonia araii]NNG95714.1 TetR/AcrR family transcriptional regulator [Gordonia araii NBRC 100433]GAB11210.1 putative TetR family transcriptional regulator [Gordonia araii NBRC 100433]
MASATPYHHGDLPSALVRAAMELLEENGAAELSLRAVARRAGVSTGAPYRHFADRNALVSAVAAVGYTELAQELVAINPAPATPDDVAALAVAYVNFALRRPGLFRVMFAEGCDTTSPDRVNAVAAIHDYLTSAVKRLLPDADPESTATGAWALVHGLAFLHLDGKLDASSPEVVAQRVSSAVASVLGLSLASRA